MPQDTLKKLRADIQSQIDALKDVVQQMGPPYADYNQADSRRWKVGEVREDGAVKLKDGTWQFANAPTGPVVNTVPNTTPAVPREYGVGAVVMFQGYTAPVLQVGDGIILVQRPDVDPIWLYPRDVVLVTPAP